MTVSVQFLELDSTIHFTHVRGQGDLVQSETKQDVDKRGMNVWANHQCIVQRHASRGFRGSIEDHSCLRSGARLLPDGVHRQVEDLRLGLLQVGNRDLFGMAEDEILCHYRCKVCELIPGMQGSLHSEESSHSLRSRFAQALDVHLLRQRYDKSPIRRAGVVGDLKC